jgi:hypothetical protein
MRKVWWTAAAALMVGAAANLAPGAGGEKQFKPDPGFTSLFNGKDLTGWMYKPTPKDDLTGKTETADGRIEVKDGVIVVNAKDKKGGGGIRDLFTVKEYNKDFHVKLEFRAAPKADSGVYIRSSGAQLQVRDYPTVGPYKPKSFKDADWNQLDIIVRAGVVSTNVNGKNLTAKDTLELIVKDGKPEAKLNGKTIDVNKIQVEVGAAAECKCNGELLEKAMKVPTKGGIGLQAETGKFEFRHIQVKELDDSGK